MVAAAVVVGVVLVVAAAVAGKSTRSLASLLVADIVITYEQGDAMRMFLVGTVGVGALAALACAAISWRTAHTTLGSLRGFAS